MADIVATNTGDVATVVGEDLVTFSPAEKSSKLCSTVKVEDCPKGSKELLNSSDGHDSGLSENNDNAESNGHAENGSTAPNGDADVKSTDELQSREGCNGDVSNDLNKKSELEAETSNANADDSSKAEAHLQLQDCQTACKKNVPPKETCESASVVSESDAGQKMDKANHCPVASPKLDGAPDSTCQPSSTASPKCSTLESKSPNGLKSAECSTKCSSAEGTDAVVGKQLEEMNVECENPIKVSPAAKKSCTAF